jgi:hypothetical protein
LLGIGGDDHVEVDFCLREVRRRMFNEEVLRFRLYAAVPAVDDWWERGEHWHWEVRQMKKREREIIDSRNDDMSNDDTIVQSVNAHVRLLS